MLSAVVVPKITDCVITDESIYRVTVEFASAVPVIVGVEVFVTEDERIIAGRPGAVKSIVI